MKKRRLKTNIPFVEKVFRVVEKFLSDVEKVFSRGQGGDFQRGAVVFTQILHMLIKQF